MKKTLMLFAGLMVLVSNQSWANTTNTVSEVYKVHAVHKVSTIMKTDLQKEIGLNIEIVMVGIVKEQKERNKAEFKAMIDNMLIGFNPISIALRSSESSSNNCE